MNTICPAYGIQMGTILGQIFCTFHKDGCIFGWNFLYISVKWVHFSGKNVCTLGHKFVPEPSITSKIHREPPPGTYRSQSTATMSEMSCVGSPTAVSTSNMVIRPALGTEAAPTDARVAVKLQRYSNMSHQYSHNTLPSEHHSSSDIRETYSAYFSYNLHNFHFVKN